MYHSTRFKQLNLSLFIENLEVVVKKIKSKSKQIKIQQLDKMSSLLIIKDIFVLDPFEFNLDEKNKRRMIRT